MKTLLATLLVSAALVAPPALAQDGPPSFTEEEVAAATQGLKDMALDTAVYQELWCGAGFQAYANYLESTGDTAGATAASGQADILFARVETELQPKNYTTEQLNDLGKNAYIVALTELMSGNEEFTQDACNATVQAQ